MNFLISISISACFALTVGWSNLVLADEVFVLKIGYDHEPPFRYKDKNGQARGSDIERVSAILESANLAFEFHHYPWKRTLRYIESGQLDLGIAAGKLKEREVYAYFSNEVFRNGDNSLYLKASTPELKVSLPTLSTLMDMPVKIGVRRGSSYSDEYEALLDEPKFLDKLVVVNSFSQAVNLAASNRIDGFIAPPEIVEYEIKKACLNTRFIKVYRLLEKEDASTYLLYSKQTISPRIVAKIDTTMRAINVNNRVFRDNYTRDTPNCENK